MTEAIDYKEQAKNFLLNSSLYSGVEDDKLIDEILSFQETFDNYCVQCGGHSIFTFSGSNPRFTAHIMIFFRCSRASEHSLYFILRKSNGRLEKIGQYPSLASIQFPELKKYAKLLGEEYSSQFGKAVGLVSHGVGIGSFVYLRRIFEKLIEDAHQEAIKEKDWDESAYVAGYMVDRVKMLAHHLPEFLVQNKIIYGVLSKGVHELSEDECLAAFPVVKTAIELILDEHLERDARKKKMEASKSALAKLASATK